MDDQLARGEGWTEERHAAFLDRVELSFVRQLLAGTHSRLGRRPPPLDRPLPDSAVESNRSGAARRRAANDDVDPAAPGC
ncbi:unnamed protein product [Urochloa decumbens]|uniref:Uncharacterized protein n=1 Tax=Urochloa decumbens TaxID=240449 RepID=A0ABC8V5U6_9POAL